MAKLKPATKAKAINIVGISGTMYAILHIIKSVIDALLSV